MITSVFGMLFFGVKISVHEGRSSQSEQEEPGCCTVQVRLYCTRPSYGRWEAKPTQLSLPHLLSFLLPLLSPRLVPKGVMPGMGPLLRISKMQVCRGMKGEGMLPSINITGDYVCKGSD